MRDTAIQYLRRGWAVIPVLHASKDPGLKGWQRLRLTESQVPKYFNGSRQNIGVLLGEPSGWLVDVDLDHPLAVALADQFLPHTPLVFGRAGKPRSHRLYRVSLPVATKKYKSKSAGMVVELRSTGTQTVFPPSTHEEGEPIGWEDEAAEPAAADPDELLRAVRHLAIAVLCELGEKPVARPKRSAHHAQAEGSPKGDRLRTCVAAMLRMRRTDHNDGSARLFAAACRIVEHDLSDAEGIAAIRDFARLAPFPKEWSDEEILARVRDAEKEATRGLIGRAEYVRGVPLVVIDTDEHRVVREAISALADDPDLYQRGGTLVRILRDRPPRDGISRCSGSATITGVPQAYLRERMTQFARFVRHVRREGAVLESAAHPTTWLVAAVDARGNWSGIRRLTGISDIPVLRADGSLWQTPGYDAVTGVVFDGSISFPQIRVDPSRDDALAAVKQLLEVVCDFRFENDDHRAAWLAALLTPLARFAFDGPTPLFLVDANVRGAGKGLLVQTISWIVLGREMPVSSYAHDSAEMCKKITAMAFAGDRMIHLDNLEGRFGNDALDRALTATRWKDRILGKSQMVDLPLHAVWFGTGNNVGVAADTTRRIIHIRLDVLDERPEERKDFKHADLIGWVRDNRALLLANALAILVSFCRAGRPDQGLTPFGSYEGWSRLVREAVVWAGLPDPCRTRLGLVESADTSTQAIRQLLESWSLYDPSNAGIVVSALIAELYPPGRDAAPTDQASVMMRAALENLVAGASGRPPTARQVGNKLRHFRRRVITGRFVDTTENRRNGAVWRICEVLQPE